MKFPLNLRGLPKETIHLYSRWITAEENNLMRRRGWRSQKENLVDFHDKCDQLCRSILKKVPLV
jgi:hypothetical protein